MTRRWSRSAAGLASILLSGALLVGGCGGSSRTSSRPASTAAPATPRTATTPTSAAERSTFNRHAGIAFGIFHRDVLAPLMGGALTDAQRDASALHRAGSAARAAAAEVHAAKAAASGGTAVRALFAPLAALGATLEQVAGHLGHGRPDPTGIKTANAAIAAIEQTARVAGVRITEQAPAKGH